ncbi:hypothetical protein AUP68_11348 [Ilyonectria robusta]
MVPRHVAMEAKASVSCGRNSAKSSVIMDDESPMIISGPGGARLDGDVMRQFFDPDKYQSVLNCLDSGQPFLRNRTFDHWPMSSFEDLDVSGRPGRKRRRARHPVHDDEDVPLVVKTTRKGINIGN